MMSSGEREHQEQPAYIRVLVTQCEAWHREGAGKRGAFLLLPHLRRKHTPSSDGVEDSDRDLRNKKVNNSLLGMSLWHLPLPHSVRFTPCDGEF